VTDHGIPSTSSATTPNRRRGRAIAAAFACGALLLWPRVAAAEQLDNFDPSFGSGGTVVSDAASGVGGMAVQSDGRLVVSGSVFDRSGVQSVAVARFNSDGTPDPSFGNGGRVALQMGAGSSPSSGATAVAVQADGKIVLVGDASDSSGNLQMLIARLTATGAPDSSFDGDGKVAVNPGSGFPTSLLNAVAIQPDGKIVVAGQAANSNGDARTLVARLEGTNGSFDSSFGSGGQVLRQLGTASGSAEQVSAIVIEPDGKIVLGGQTADASHHIELLLARLNGADGSLDSGFGSGGKVVSQLGLGSSPLSAVLSLVRQPDGKILAGGDATPAGGNAGLLVARYTSTGAPDGSFGSSGKLVVQVGDGFGAFSSAASLALQSDGKVVAAGVATDSGGDNSLLVARLGGDGKLDSGFAAGGLFQQQLGAGDLPSSQAQSVAVLPDGRLQIGGVVSTTSGDTNLLLARIFHDAAPLPAFSLVTKPAAAEAPVVFDGSASSDPDGGVAAYSWDFGDGGRGSGARPSHVYQQAGDYTVRLTVTDDKGLPASVSHTVSIGPPNSLNPAFLATLSKLGLSPSAFRAAGKGGSVARATGTSVSYRDSRTAVTTFEVRRAMLGSFSKGHCAKPSPSLHGRRCARFVKIGEFTHSDKLGLNRFHFTGRLNGHKLPPGRYHLRGVPALGGRLGIAARTEFRILP
jgi:uncharacterized delta-60 repeat protein